MTDAPAMAGGPVLRPPTHISLGYSQSEDRLVLWIGSGEGAPTLHLTRRLTGMLLNGLAGILARSSAMAAQAPADLRDEVVMMEHQGATTAAGPVPADPASLPPPAPPILVQTVNITTHTTSFSLVLRTGEDTEVASLRLSRAELHRVIELLRRQSDVAGWALPVDAGWLAPVSGQVTVN